MATNFLFLSSILLLILLLLHSSSATQRSLRLVQQPSTVLKYHNGSLLKGHYTVNLLFYGDFSSPQISIISNFLLSLSSPSSPSRHPPSVHTWWATTSSYLSGPSILTLGSLSMDHNCSLGKSLTSDHLTYLASHVHNNIIKGMKISRSITAVFTSSEVSVQGFCSSRCGTHVSVSRSRPYLWVGNPETQCPGQCAWPFHRPMYGPQTPPLVAPNGDVGVDGMIINLATVLAGAVTNPYGNGFYQGPTDAQLEAVSACTGMFGSGSYPGYPGKVLVDAVTGASYNAEGVNGRKYLLPAMWDPRSSRCATLT